MGRPKKVVEPLEVKELPHITWTGSPHNLVEQINALIDLLNKR